MLSVLTQSFPRFWVFMYRVSPFTYLVSAMLSVGVANTEVECGDVELLHLDPPSANLTCSQFLDPWISQAGGRLVNPDATTDCGYCPISDTNVFLASVSSYYSDRWRNFGIMWVFVVFNIAFAVGIYWLARVPKKREQKQLTAKKKQ